MGVIIISPIVEKDTKSREEERFQQGPTALVGLGPESVHLSYIMFYWASAVHWIRGSV